MKANEVYGDEKECAERVDWRKGGGWALQLACSRALVHTRALRLPLAGCSFLSHCSYQFAIHNCPHLPDRPAFSLSDDAPQDPLIWKAQMQIMLLFVTLHRHLLSHRGRTRGSSEGSGHPKASSEEDLDTLAKCLGFQSSAAMVPVEL